MTARVDKMDFGNFTRQDMKDLLRRVLEETIEEDVIDVLKDRDYIPREE